VMMRYETLGIRVYQSVWCGASTWRSVTPAVVQCARDEQRRYWHHVTPIESRHNDK
jgi:competence protein ComEC